MKTDDDTSVIFGLEHQCRTLCPVRSEQNEVMFLIGTQSLRFENQVCLLKYHEDTHQVSRHSWSHLQGEIWHIGSSPNSPVFSTCYQAVENGRLKAGCSIWKLDTKGRQNPSELTQPEKVCDIVGPDSTFKSVNLFDWQPSADESAAPERAFLLADSNIVIYDLNSGSGPRESAKTELSGKVPPRLITGQWSTHHGGNVIAAAHDSSLKGWDLRAFDSPIWSLDGAHVPTVRGADFNPNVQYYVATCGDDCTVKIWDTRNREEPLSTISSRHSHWVWSVKFNPVHDELLLSCSSDAKLILHSLASLSSEASRKSDDTDEIDKSPLLNDGIIRSYEEHEESVYCAQWSSADNWVFASLSYDGRLIINHVPSTVKEHILYG